MVVKSGRLGGNADTFMPIFSADALALAIYAKLEMEIQFVKNGPYST